MHDRLSGLSLFCKGSFCVRLIVGLALAPLFIFIVYLGDVYLAVFLLIAFGRAVFEWYRMSGYIGRKIAVMLAGSVYLGVSFLSFFLLREGFSGGFFLVTSILLTVWTADTGAYLSGKLIGGAKMSPSISPNKTWAGFFGAVILSGLMYILCGIGFGGFSDEKILPALYIWEDGKFSSFMLFLFCFVTGAIVAGFGQLGDLLVSKLKRVSGVKDSGNLIPGHGGLLDRIDALLLVVPLYTLAVWITGLG